MNDHGIDCGSHWHDGDEAYCTCNAIPRRANMKRWCEAEKAIFAATEVVERMPADSRLTEVVVLLGRARQRVADYIDGQKDPSSL